MAGEPHSALTLTPRCSPEHQDIIMIVSVQDLPLFVPCILVWLTCLWAFPHNYAFISNLLVDILLIMFKPKRNNG